MNTISIQESQHTNSFTQYRSSVANQICMTLKNKYNKDLSIRGSSGTRNNVDNYSNNNVLSTKDEIS